ncbi:hypothetical protein RB595_002514 [Gaeumannomyces hyphopodioides]
MHRTNSPRLSRWLVFAILACLLIQGVYARPSGGRGHAGSNGRRLRRGRPRPHTRAGSGGHARHEPRQEGACAPSPPASIKAPKRNLWAQLSEQEVGSVVDWLFRQRGLNLTRTEDAGDWDNTIISVEVMRPNKSDALGYIDGNGPEPAKYARVTLDQRATDSPVIAEILVGPLPISRATASWSPLAYPFTKDSGGRIRNLEADAGESLYDRWLYRHTRDIMDVTLDLLNGTVLGRRNDTLEIWGIDPLWQDEGGRVRRWDTLWNLPTDYSDAQSLLPTGLFLLTDVTGRDPSAWRLEGWLYGGVFYNSTAAFRAAYWAPGFEKLGVNVEGDWARTDHAGPAVMPLDDRRPPVLAAPGGSRFSLDAGERYVEWMGFSFYLGFAGDTGVSLHDVRFEGERVLYELGLQEALSHYAGNDPVQSGTAYLDNSYGFGRYATEMVVGFDAPSYATYLDATAYEYEGLAPRRRAVALFEAAADHALQRHSTDGTVSVTRNTYLVVRQVATVANYDYTVSYTFTLSGEVAVDVRASGFVQAAHRSGSNDDDDGNYGFAVRDHLSGSMHDHVIAFKADFDVAGAANTVELVRSAPAVVSYPWPGGASRSTMRLERSVVASEGRGRLDWDAEGATQVRVVNRATAAAARGGEARGYRVVRSGPTARLTVRGSPALQNAARWAEHDIHVTRHKDTEPWLSHASNNQDVADPLVDFSRFAADDEGLVQEDVVLWLNLGMHHVPVKEDLPNTLTTTAHSGVRFVPSNFRDTDPSRRTVNMARISYREGRTTDVVVFGQSKDVCSMRLEPDELGLWSYAGSSTVHEAGQGRGGSSRGQGRDSG